MTNKEKFRDELENYGLCNINWGVTKDDEFNPCYKMKCDDCIFNEYTTGCQYLKFDWLNEEYDENKNTINWSKVPVDTPILVSNNNNVWYYRHFAKYKDKIVYAFLDGRTSWSSKNDIFGNDNTELKFMDWKYAKLADGSEE